MTEPTIRDATIDDLDAVAALFDDYRVFYRRESDPEGARTYMKERLSNGDSRVFVADDNGTLLAFAQLYPTFSSVDLGTMWLFNDLYVDPAARRRGVARAMMQRVERLGRETGAAKLFLRTERINTAGQACYEDAGWTLDERFLTYQKYL
ncbi:N-acetyltransferase family protein [Arhodomonas sp. KWT2]|uniref:GNAT family N-acetyltransferase n=1 Tax=unclassified Arhodomonas TaxID=2621637 RepID=UPI0013D5889A|nr:GNAT family N-acetyltransferase [Arhodomonas sp. KWT]